MCWMGIAAIGYFIAETVHTSRAHRFQHQRDDDDDDNDAQDIVNFRLKVNAFLSLSHDGSRSFDKCLCLCMPSFNTLYFIVQPRHKKATRNDKTLPKAQGTRGLSSAYQSLNRFKYKS